MSYLGTDEAEYYRLLGIYAAKVLKGERPADLPVKQVHEVRADHQSQDAPRRSVSMCRLPLLARADEVIE